MDYGALRAKPRQFLALTSRHVAEFDALLTAFAPAWERHHRWHTLQGNGGSSRPTGNAPRPCWRAVTCSYSFCSPTYKSARLQPHQAARFGSSQARVSQLAAGLLPVFQQVLARHALLPVRQGADLAQRLAGHPEPVFAYDEVERDVPRNADYAAQAAEYSTKKSPSRPQHDPV